MALSSRCIANDAVTYAQYFNHASGVLALGQ
jgi:hypothetical protein